MKKIDKKLPKIVVSGLIEQDGKYLLIEETIEDNQKHWLIPGGKVDFGETLEQALLREIKEETGLEVKVDRFLDFHEAIFPNFDYHTVIFFYLVKPVGGELKLEEKISDANFFSLDELSDLPLVSSARWLLDKLSLLQ